MEVTAERISYSTLNLTKGGVRELVGSSDQVSLFSYSGVKAWSVGHNTDCIQRTFIDTSF